MKTKWSIAGLVGNKERDSLLMVNEDSLWGLPAGKLEPQLNDGKNWEVLIPRLTLQCEILEETRVYVDTRNMKPWGVSFDFNQSHISVGLIFVINEHRIVSGVGPMYKDEVQEARFVGRDEVLNMMSRGVIRYPKKNIPPLNSFLSGVNYYLRINNRRFTI